MTFEEYMKSLGATEEDLKTLSSPLLRRGFDALQEKIATAARERDDAKAGATAYEARANEWFESEKTNLAAAKSAATTAAAEAARYRAALLTAHKQGLIDVAKDMGFKPEELEVANPNPNPNPNANPNPGNPGFDPNKYFTRDEIVHIAEREGDAIAVSMDIAAEHVVLFPTQPLNFRKLRQEAVAAKKPVEQYWMETYKVKEAREARDRKAAEDHDNAIRTEERKKVETEFASRMANPDARPLSPSNSPFAPRPAGNTRTGKQPWETGENFNEQLANDRVTRATQKVLTTAVH